MLAAGLLVLSSSTSADVVPSQPLDLWMTADDDDDDDVAATAAVRCVG